MGTAERVSGVDVYTDAVWGMSRGGIVSCAVGVGKIGSDAVGSGEGGIDRCGSAGGAKLGGMCRDEMMSTGSGEGSHTVTIAMASTDGMFEGWTTLFIGWIENSKLLIGCGWSALGVVQRISYCGDSFVEV